VKVIFIEDVPNVARAGQNKVVADGYARNYLFPRRLAVLADSRAAAAVEAHIRKVTRQRAIAEAEMAELAKLITGTEITLKAKVGEKEHLYGSVTGADIAGELSRVISREVDKRKIDLAEPIRQVGVYDVTVRFTHDITAVVSVTVMSDEEGAVRPVRAEKPPEAVAEKETKAEKAEKKEKKPREKKEKPPRAEKPAEVKEEAVPAAAVETPVAAAVAEKGEEKEARAVKKEKKAKKEDNQAEKEAEPPKAEKKEKTPKTEKKAKKSETKAEEGPREN
jgi:large subunit ribosomal protein L9